MRWHRGPDFNLRAAFEDDADRFEKLSVTYQPLTMLVDFSKNLVTTETMDLLMALVRERKVEHRRSQMFAGERINVTEERAVLHTALRNRLGKRRGGGLLRCWLDGGGGLLMEGLHTQSWPHMCALWWLSPSPFRCGLPLCSGCGYMYPHGDVHKHPAALKRGV